MLRCHHIVEVMGTWMRASASQGPADLTELDEDGHLDAELKLGTVVYNKNNSHYLVIIDAPRAICE